MYHDSLQDDRDDELLLGSIMSSHILGDTSVRAIPQSTRRSLYGNDDDRPLFAHSNENLDGLPDDFESPDQESLSLSSGDEQQLLQRKSLSKRPPSEEPVQLNQYLATAICGNDILGSCLYAAGLVAVPAGRWSPVCFVLVGMLLFLFRIIYEEVGQALPVNGGTYTLLLNTCSKRTAAFGGSLTLLSYVATAVVSANSAMHYLHQLISLGVYWATVALLFFFAVINLVGIRESAYNALAIFVIHLVTLGIYAVSCILFMINDGGQVLMQNLRTPPVDTDFTAIFCGFAVALLGGP
jgi:hypothetical protein